MHGGKSNFWGEEIYKLRMERGLSQRQLANEAQVNRSTLRRIEEGMARGDIDVIGRLLDYMGYGLDMYTVESIKKKKLMSLQEAADPVRKSRDAMSRLLGLQFGSQWH